MVRPNYFIFYTNMAATPFSGLQMGYFDVRVANSFSGRKVLKKCL